MSTLSSAEISDVNPSLYLKPVSKKDGTVRTLNLSITSIHSILVEVYLLSSNPV